MKHFFNKKTWLITLLIYIIAIVLSILIASWQKSTGLKTARAGAEHNVSGWAWSANFGWVSFNCANDSTCGTSDYGVNIDTTSGNFSGYAWSSNLGWIDFAPVAGYPEAPNTGAHYNSATGAVTGWAKVLVLGDDGWLKMSGAWANGISINSSTGDFSGWAWNGNSAAGTGLGWLSFNCVNESPACSGANYKVIANINALPQASYLTAPNWNFSQASQFGALNAKLAWTFSDPDAGASQSAYQIIVNTSNSISDPLFDSGKCLGYNNPSAKCKVDNGAAGTTNFPLNAADGLNYNTPYYWWVRVWDNYDLASGLKQYDTTPDTDNDDGNPLTFTTYKHEMPEVSFSWFPANPSQGEEVKFTDTSQVYLTSAPDTAVNCAAALCDWLWTVPEGASIDDTAAPTPTIIFDSAGSFTVMLTVTDQDGYYASHSEIINVNAKLPIWREVKPE